MRCNQGRKGLIVCVLSIILVSPLRAQVDSVAVGSSAETSKVSPARVAIIGGTLIGSMVAIHIYQANGWWKDNRTSFHFREDLKYGLWVDKIGHFYGATAQAFVFRKSFQWANLSEEKALWWGSGAAALFQTYVEMEDGFSTWGFDRVDFTFDMAGAAWPVAQYYAPFLQNFDFKFSYHPSPELHGGGGIGFKGQKHIIFDDYEGQTLWLSARVKNLLPARVSLYWPEFLCVAVGYGARKVVSPDAHPVVFLALDFDFTKIIPDDTSFLKTLGEALNFIHFPAPAVRISPSAVWYGFYF